MKPDKLWVFQTFTPTFKDLTINNFNDNDNLKNIFYGFSVNRQTDE